MSHYTTSSANASSATHRLTCLTCNHVANGYYDYINHLAFCPFLPQVLCGHCQHMFTDTEELAVHFGMQSLFDLLSPSPTSSSQQTSLPFEPMPVYSSTASRAYTFTSFSPTTTSTIPRFTTPSQQPPRMLYSSNVPFSGIPTRDIIHALSASNYLINYQTILLAWLTYYLLLIPHQHWPALTEHLEFLRHLLSYSPYWPRQLPPNANILEIVRSLQQEFFSYLMRPPY